MESWITERDLCSLFQRHHFNPVGHERVYLDLPRMSMLHSLAASQRVRRLMSRAGLTCLHKGLQYRLGFYQVWCFQSIREPR